MAAVKLLSRLEVLLCLLAAIVLLSFTQGLMTAAGFSDAVPKALIEGGSLLAFGWTLTFRLEGARRAAPLLAPLLGMAFVGFLSALVNEQGLLAGGLFVRQAVGPALLIACGLVLADDLRASRALCVLALGCLALQPCVAVAKLITIGIDEKFWIGTLHQSAGQLGLLLPMVGIATAIPLAMIFRPTAVLFVPLFVLFGIVGEKRASVVLLPLVILLATAASLLVVRIRLRLDSSWARCEARCRVATIGVLTLSLIGAAVGGTLSIPSLNPAGVAGGGFKTSSDPPGSTVLFALNYIHDYLVRDFNHEMNKSEFTVEENTNIQLGRLRIIIEASKAVAGFDTRHFLFGLGGSAIDESYLLGADRRDMMFRTLGLRGPTPLALKILIEAGFVGLAFAVIWFITVSVRLLIQLARASGRFAVSLALVALGWHIGLFFDYFLYSTVFWTTGTLGVSYCVLIGLALAVGSRSSSEPTVRRPAMPY